MEPNDTGYAKESKAPFPVSQAGAGTTYRARRAQALRQSSSVSDRAV